MKVLILNSGLGHRMGSITASHPKCMTEITDSETILSRQLRMLSQVGITEVVMTTGYYDSVLIDYCLSLNFPLHYTFVNNPLYAQTNYIYSIYCAQKYLEGDLLLIHGDLVFEQSVLQDLLTCNSSCMKVSTSVPLPQKDFKAVVHNGFVEKVGIEFFSDAVEAQAMYKLQSKDWKIWLDRICRYCEAGNTNCYAEVALNEIANLCNIKAIDVKDRLCTEIDTLDDLKKVKELISE